MIYGGFLMGSILNAGLTTNKFTHKIHVLGNQKIKS
jgi:hypothetical protein